jgi:hypothetical protein
VLFSTRITRHPAILSNIAVAAPAGPAPMTNASASASIPLGIRYPHIVSRRNEAV